MRSYTAAVFNACIQMFTKTCVFLRSHRGRPASARCASPRLSRNCCRWRRTHSNSSRATVQASKHAHAGHGGTAYIDDLRAQACSQRSQTHEGRGCGAVCSINTTLMCRSGQLTDQCRQDTGKRDGTLSFSSPQNADDQVLICSWVSCWAVHVRDCRGVTCWIIRTV